MLDRSEDILLAVMGGYEDDEDFASSGPAEGYSVCARCFDDRYIRAFIEKSLDSKECDFCGRKGRTKNIAAPLNEVVDFILEAVNREYQHAVEALGWESAEGGYQGAHWDSYDLIEQIGLGLPNDDGELLEVLVECFGNEPWCDRNPYSQREDERLVSSWERFCEFIKYKRRYFFFQQKEEEILAPGEYLSPAELLELIGETAKNLGLVKILRAGFLIYRARQFEAGKVLTSSYDFAPPPVERAVKSNRMSPAGVVMFYGSDDAKTAVAEIDDDPTVGIAVGTFRTTREAKILDLTSLPRRLGFFERQSDSDDRNRYELAFLHNFVKSIAAKVAAGHREHIDYVPTQVVTEWFRTAFECRQTGIDGILYPSAQNPGGCSLVLFANRYDVVLSPAELKAAAGGSEMEVWSLRHRHEKAWLKLIRRRVVRIAQG
jgi:hypothetical protein